VIKYVIAVAAMGVTGAALAANDVALKSSVFVERSVPDANGRQTIVLEEPGAIARGDRLVFVLNYRNVGAQTRTAFTITNPLPRPVAFQGTSDSGAIVSVDGGRTWGLLASLRVRDTDGSLRGARSEDVTHVRWTLRRTIPVGQGGRVSFRGIVR